MFVLNCMFATRQICPAQHSAGFLWILKLQIVKYLLLLQWHLRLASVTPAAEAAYGQRSGQENRVQAEVECPCPLAATRGQPRKNVLVVPAEQRSSVTLDILHPALRRCRQSAQIRSVEGSWLVWIKALKWNVQVHLYCTQPPPRGGDQAVMPTPRGHRSGTTLMASRTRPCILWPPPASYQRLVWQANHGENGENSREIAIPESCWPVKPARPGLTLSKAESSRSESSEKDLDSGYSDAVNIVAKSDRTCMKISEKCYRHEELHGCGYFLLCMSQCAITGRM